MCAAAWVEEECGRVAEVWCCVEEVCVRMKRCVLGWKRSVVGWKKWKLGGFNGKEY